MAAMALVHGAWGGAWIWRDVLPGVRAAGHALPRAFIDCGGAYSTINTVRQRVQAQGDWTALRLSCGHGPMVQAPAGLTAAWLGLVAPA